jgi:uncharacterized protein (TIGR02646 family)
MKYTRRTSTPVCLKGNSRIWGNGYENYLQLKPKSQYFSWHSCYNELEDALFRMNVNHCSFCDMRPLRASGPTIEHFKPKKKYPRFAYFWSNLFYACSNCQKKNKKTSSKLLKPDDPNYDFKHFFIRVFSTGEIKPNPARSNHEQERAKITIEFYGLNKWDRPDERFKERNDFLEDQKLGKAKANNIDNYSYRFYLQ